MNFRARAWPQTLGLMLLWAIALAAGWRESVLQGVALAGSIWATLILVFSKRQRSQMMEAADDLRWLALAFFLFFLLHLVRVDHQQSFARLDGPSRALLFAPLLGLPLVAGWGWPACRQALVASGWVLGLGSLIQFFLEPTAGRNFAFFTYSNLLGYAAMTVLGVLATTANTGPKRWPAWTSMACCLGVVVASGTRGALVALPLIALLALAPLVRAKGLSAKKLMLGVAALGLALWLAWPKVDQRLQDAHREIELITQKGDYNSSIGQRLAMWQVSAAMIADKPWTGQGINVFPSQMQPWADRLGLKVRFAFGGFQNPHNLFLGWAASLGLPTTLLLIALFWGVPGWVSRRQVAAHPSNAAVHQAHRALMTLLSLLALFCLTESVIERQRGMAWYAVWICLILGAQAMSASKQRPHPDRH